MNTAVAIVVTVRHWAERELLSEGETLDLVQEMLHRRCGDSTEDDMLAIGYNEIKEALETLRNDPS